MSGLPGFDAESFGDFATRPLPLVLRPARRGLEGLATLEKATSDPIPWWPQARRLRDLDHDAGRGLDHALGHFYLQDAASMLPVAALLATMTGPRRRFLDLCAAPGSKATQLAQSLPTGSWLLANEPSGSRRRVLAANLLRCGIDRVMLAGLDGEPLCAAFPDHFDGVLVDAPCSGEGTTRRDPRALDDWNLERSRVLAETQLRLVLAAARATRPGGIVVYSTCAMTRTENDEVCARALDQAGPGALEPVDLGSLFPDAASVRTPGGHLRLFPQSFDTGGFFVAALRRGLDPIPFDPGAALPLPPAPQPFPISPLAEPVRAALQDRFGLADSDLDGQILARNDDVLLVPDGAPDWSERIALARSGFRLGRFTKTSTVGFDTEHFQPHHDLALLRGAAMTRHRIEVDRAMAVRHFAGLDLFTLTLGDEGPWLLSHDSLPVGFAQARKRRVLPLRGAAWIRTLSAD